MKVDLTIRIEIPRKIKFNELSKYLDDYFSSTDTLKEIKEIEVLKEEVFTENKRQD